MRVLFGPGLLNLLNTALVYATSVWLLLHLSPRLTLLALSPTRAAPGRRALSSRHIYRASRAIQEQLGTMSTAIQEDLAGIAVIKHYALEEPRQRAFRARQRRVPGARADAGAGARHADAAVRDAGRRRAR